MLKDILKADSRCSHTRSPGLVKAYAVSPAAPYEDECVRKAVPCQLVFAYKKGAFKLAEPFPYIPASDYHNPKCALYCKLGDTAAYIPAVNLYAFYKAYGVLRVYQVLKLFPCVLDAPPEGLICGIR